MDTSPFLNKELLAESTGNKKKTLRALDIMNLNPFAQNENTVFQ